MKYKLVIPEKFIGVMDEYHKDLDGKTLKHWEPEIHKTGWLVEVKEPMTKDEVWSEYLKKWELLEYGREKFNFIWETSRENLLLEQEQNNKLRDEWDCTKEQENDK